MPAVPMHPATLLWKITQVPLVPLACQCPSAALLLSSLLSGWPWPNPSDTSATASARREDDTVVMATLCPIPSTLAQVPEITE